MIMMKTILVCLSIFAAFLAAGKLSDSVKRKEKEYLDHLDNFENDHDYAMNHLMDDVDLQEEYVKNELKNQQQYILARMETQFAGRKFQL